MCGEPAVPGRPCAALLRSQRSCLLSRRATAQSCRRPRPRGPLRGSPGLRRAVVAHRGPAGQPVPARPGPCGSPARLRVPRGPRLGPGHTRGTTRRGRGSRSDPQPRGRRKGPGTAVGLCPPTSSAGSRARQGPGQHTGGQQGGAFDMRPGRVPCEPPGKSPLLSKGSMPVISPRSPRHISLRRGGAAGQTDCAAEQARGAGTSSQGTSSQRPPSASLSSLDTASPGRRACSSEAGIQPFLLHENNAGRGLCRLSKVLSTSVNFGETPRMALVTAPSIPTLPSEGPRRAAQGGPWCRAGPRALADLSAWAPPPLCVWWVPP